MKLCGSLRQAMLGRFEDAGFETEVSPLDFLEARGVSECRARSVPIVQRIGQAIAATGVRHHRRRRYVLAEAFFRTLRRTREAQTEAAQKRCAGHAYHVACLSCGIGKAWRICWEWDN